MGNVKQVIIMRKDLNMRKGKMIAQGSHASLGVILNMMKKKQFFYDTVLSLHINKDTPIEKWMNGSFTKISLSVNSEEELMEIYEKAKDLPRILIEDKGLTEFNGVVTKTCIAIGPALSSDIDKITGNLKLL